MSVYANYGITFQLKYTKYIMYLYTVACLLYQNHNRTLIILVVLEIEKKKCKITCTCNVCQRFFLFIYDFFKLKNNCINCLSTLYQIQEMQIFTFEKKNFLLWTNEIHVHSKNVHFCNKRENFDPSNASRKKMKPNLSV